MVNFFSLFTGLLGFFCFFFPSDYYPNCEVQYKCLPNIHAVRKSFLQLRAVLMSDDQLKYVECVCVCVCVCVCMYVCVCVCAVPVFMYIHVCACILYINVPYI